MRKHTSRDSDNDDKEVMIAKDLECLWEKKMWTYEKSFSKGEESKEKEKERKWATDTILWI